MGGITAAGSGLAGRAGRAAGIPQVPPEDIAFLRQLTSTPLLKVTTPRFDTPGTPFVVEGKALRNTFVPVGPNVDDAAAAAIEMTKRSRDLRTDSPGIQRATAVVQSTAGNHYLVGLHQAAWDPAMTKQAALEARDGVVKPAGLTDQTIPPGMVEANQFANGNLYLDDTVDSYFGQPVVQPLEPGIVGVANSQRYVALTPGRSEPIPGTWPQQEAYTPVSRTPPR